MVPGSRFGPAGRRFRVHSRWWRTSCSVALVSMIGAAACGPSSSEPARDADGNLVDSGRLHLDQLREVDCTLPHDVSSPDVEAGPCDDIEDPRVVVAIDSLPEGSFDQGELDEVRRELCERTHPDPTGGEATYAYLQPSEEAWDQGMRSVVCLTAPDTAEAP